MHQIDLALLAQLRLEARAVDERVALSVKQGDGARDVVRIVGFRLPKRAEAAHAQILSPLHNELDRRRLGRELKVLWLVVAVPERVAPVEQIVEHVVREALKKPRGCIVLHNVHDRNECLGAEKAHKRIAGLVDHVLQGPVVDRPDEVCWCERDKEVDFVTNGRIMRKSEKRLGVALRVPNVRALFVLRLGAHKVHEGGKVVFAKFIERPVPKLTLASMEGLVLGDDAAVVAQPHIKALVGEVKRNAVLLVADKDSRRLEEAMLDEHRLKCRRPILGLCAIHTKHLKNKAIVRQHIVLLEAISIAHRIVTDVGAMHFVGIGRLPLCRKQPRPKEIRGAVETPPRATDTTFVLLKVGAKDKVKEKDARNDLPAKLLNPGSRAGDEAFLPQVQNDGKGACDAEADELVEGELHFDGDE
eukprot:Opistho-2@54371